MMRRVLWISALAGAVLGWSAAAQTAAQTQGTAGAGGNVSAAGAQAGASSNTQASGAASGQSAEAGAQNDTSVHGQTEQNRPESKKSAKPEKEDRDGEATTGSLAGGTKIEAELTKSLDSRKAKPGDAVQARVTRDVRSQSGVVIRRGAKLVGHVTEAKARAKGDSDSALGVVFDKAIFKGREIPLNATIQALGAARHAATMATSDMDAGTDTENDMGGSAGRPAGSMGGGGPVGAAGSAVGGVGNAAGQTVGGIGQTAGGIGQSAGSAVGATTNAAGNTAGTAGGAAGATLNTSSSGVVGLRGLSLSSAAGNSTQGSVITSTGKDVRLDSGTQMVLDVVAP